MLWKTVEKELYALSFKDYKREVSFSDVGDYLVNQFAATWITIPADFQISTLNGLTVGVENDLLSEALRELPDKKREILLLLFLLYGHERFRNCRPVEIELFYCLSA